MLDYATINEIAQHAAREALGDGNVDRVLSEPMTDGDGNDLVRLTIVVPPDALDHVQDQALFDTLRKINKSLRENGEDRQSIVFYASEQELAASGDPEP